MIVLMLQNVCCKESEEGQVTYICHSFDFHRKTEQDPTALKCGRAGNWHIFLCVQPPSVLGYLFRTSPDFDIGFFRLKTQIITCINSLTPDPEHDLPLHLVSFILHSQQDGNVNRDDHVVDMRL